MSALAVRSSPGSANDSLMVMKFWLIADGIFIWEFIANLNYEWTVIIRRRQPYRWAVWIYFVARWCTLAVVVLDLISFNFTEEINCQGWAYSIWAFGVIGLSSGQLLIMLRIFAIWNKQLVIVAITVGTWLTNVTLMVISAVRINTVWEPTKRVCVVTNIQSCKSSLIVLLGADVVLLLIMLAGLLRLRRHGGGSLAIGRLLWKQGCIWFAIATAAELPQVVLVILNANDVIKMMFVVPAMITMTLAATRMYRSLTNFASPQNTAADSETSRRNRLVSSVVYKPSKQLEVTVHTAYEEHAIAQAHRDACTGSYGQSADKSNELTMHDKETVIDIADSVKH